jgi:hypothetical protein
MFSTDANVVNIQLFYAVGRLIQIFKATMYAWYLELLSTTSKSNLQEFLAVEAETG